MLLVTFIYRVKMVSKCNVFVNSYAKLLQAVNLIDIVGHHIWALAQKLNSWLFGIQQNLLHQCAFTKCCKSEI